MIRKIKEWFLRKIGVIYIDENCVIIIPGASEQEIDHFKFELENKFPQYKYVVYSKKIKVHKVRSKKK